MPDAPLDPQKSLASEVRRAVETLLGDAETRLRLPGKSGEAGLDKAVHESRKRIKEVRSLLRLFRMTLTDADGTPVRPRVNVFLRETAHLLGGAREAAVAVETLDALTHDAPALRDALVGEHRTLLDGSAADAATDAATRLASVRSEAVTWHVPLGDFGDMAPGLRRIYRDGRRAFRDALASAGDVEAWHDWRKRAKDLRYAAEFLRLCAPNVLGGVASLAKSVTGDLGDDHDLAELAAAARRLGDAQTANAAEAKRPAKQASARDGGHRLYAEETSAFVDAVCVYWDAAAGRGGGRSA